MKHYLSTCFFITLLSCSASAQIADRCAEISLSPDTLNLGVIPINTALYEHVTIKNTGNCPLIISQVLGGKPREFAYNKYFYQPGDTGSLGILIMADKTGDITHTLTIYSNAGQAQKTILITGNVIKNEPCAQMAFDSDTLDLGSIPYLFGKHFALNVYNRGKCPMQMQIAPGDDLLSILEYPQMPLNAGDTGTIGLHIGGQFTGNYVGEVVVSSATITGGYKALFLKAKLLAPDRKDTADTQIKVDQDMFNFGTVYSDASGNIKPLTCKLKISNTGKKPLKLGQAPTKAVHIKDMPDKPIMPGQSVIVTLVFYAGDTDDTALDELPVIEHIILSGNFPGKNLPIYGKWYHKKKS